MRRCCLGSLAALLLAACARESSEQPGPAGGRPGKGAPVVSDHALATFGQSLGGVGAGPALEKRPAKDELGDILAQFARTHDVSRSRFVHTVRTKIAEYDDLLRMLVAAGADTAPAVLVPAIEMVGWLRLAGPESDLLHHAERGPGVVRAAATRALQRYGFWNRGTVLPRLKDPDPEFLSALLDCVALLDDPPAVELVPLLGHADARVREAAANAFPGKPGREAMTALQAFVDRAPAEQRIETFRLLGRLSGPERDASLLRGVGSSDWSVRHAALIALFEGDGPLADPAPLWLRIADRQATVVEQVHVLAIVERRALDGAARLRALAGAMHPVAKLHAARCLVAIGDASAPGLLIELLGTVEGPTVDDEDMQCARGEARRILAELAEDDLGPAPEPWQRWYRQAGPLAPRRIETPPCFFW